MAPFQMVTGAAMTKLRPDNCESLIVHGSSRRICVRDDSAHVAKCTQSLADLQQILLVRQRSLVPLAP